MSPKPSCVTASCSSRASRVALLADVQQAAIASTASLSASVARVAAMG